MEKILSELGLTKNETKIYLALLKCGSMSLKDLSKTANIYRQNALDSLERLRKRGLVTISFEGTQGKRKIYSALSPEHLSLLLEEKQKRFEAALPALLALSARTEKPKIDILCGSEGIKAILNDEIATGKTMHVIQSSQTVDTRLGDTLAISREKRWRVGITMKIIYSKRDKTFGEAAKRFPKTEVRYSNEDFGSTTIDVYGNRSILIFGSEPTIVRIIDEEVAKRFLGFFWQSWEKARRV